MAEDVPADAAPKKKSKLLLYVAVGVVVLVVTGVGGAFALGLFGGDDEAVAGVDGADAAHAAAGADSETAAHAGGGGETSHADGAIVDEPVFIDLPQLLVNLVVPEGRPRFLKLSLAVEVDDQATADRIQRLAPRVVDSFQLYLRTLTPEELQGPGSMFRLKENLHVRIHQAIEPDRVRDVLFKEMLVQ